MKSFIVICGIAGVLFGGRLDLVGAVVFLPDAAKVEERRAAEELAVYWEKMTGNDVEVRPEPDRVIPREVRPRFHRFRSVRARERETEGAGPIAFFVGETDAARRFASLPSELDREGFLLSGRGNRLFLRGASPAGTRNAVYRFLHEYGKVRWYLPTELGEEVPEWTASRLPSIHRMESPGFRSRQWSNASQFTDDDWESRNLVRPRFRFHHSLHRMFTEEVFELRPDFFIQLRGERVRPDNALGGLNHQICFGNPDAAKFAARKAAEYFEANPDELSFAVSMNDTEQICQCSDCQRWVDPEKRFRDRPDYSDLVFTFINRVAEELTKTHPDKYIGTLAYHWAENVPSFPVHANVIPYLTADRSMWHDEAFRQEDRELMRRWGQAGPERLGIYDYYYGSSYVIPRLFTGITADSLRQAREAGIDGFYAEIYSNWGLDGPKAWLTSQLLWDPAGHPEVLLEEFYREYFKGAAAPMARFFERAEEIWMEQGEPVFWLKFYFDFTQLELFPPTVCAELRTLLTEAENLAEDEVQKERVALVSEAFRTTELYSDLYHELKRATVELESVERTELMSVLRRALRQREALERHYEEVVFPDDLLRPTGRMESGARHLPGMKLGRLIERAARLSGDDGEEQELRELVTALGVAFPESAASLVFEHRAEAGSELLLNNGDFETDADWTGRGEELVDNPAHTPFFWKRQQSPGAAVSGDALVMTNREARDGEFSIRVRGAVREMLYQRFDASPGSVYRFSAWVKGRVSPGSYVEIELAWRDVYGKRVGGEFLILDRLLPGDVPDWRELMVVAEAPRGAVDGFANLNVRDQATDDVVFFDGGRVEGY